MDVIALGFLYAFAIATLVMGISIVSMVSACCIAFIIELIRGK